MGFSFVSAFPEACQIKCFCYKCGLKNLPNIMTEWWCEGVCCCNFSNCGLRELLDCQIYILGPCKLTAPALNFNFKVPVTLQLIPCMMMRVTSCPCCSIKPQEALTVNVLCKKCGIQDFPDFRREDFIQQTCCCLHYEFGFKECLSVFQLFCFKFDTGVKIGVWGA